MEQQGEYIVSASREEVWAALNDPEVLGACIPGCQKVERIDDTHFDAKVKAKVGPVSATFEAALELADLDPPNSYTIGGNVKGGAAGFGKGQAAVQLEEDGDNTRLIYKVNANVGGKLAQIGSRLIDGTARKMADDFFSAFAEQVGRSSTEVNAEDGAEAVAEIVAEEMTVGARSDDTQVAEPGDSQKKAAQPRDYESSGNMGIWIVAFVVLFASVLLAI